MSCRYHLALDVTRRGSIRVAVAGNPPNTFDAIADAAVRALDHAPATCALDVADLGGLTLEQIREYTGLSREWVRQLEDKALRSVRASKGMDDAIEQ